MPTAVASKVCTEEGKWWLHPDSNRTWTNFTICKANNSHHHSVRRDSKGSQRVRVRDWEGGWGRG